MTMAGSLQSSSATISPDGSRVVYAGLTRTPEEGGFCHNGALFAVDADGGSAEVLWESEKTPSRGPKGGLVKDPMFSPDGTKIAFVDGYCDHDHSVWVMNADGSDARRIVSNETLPVAGRSGGVAWLPDGARLAVKLADRIYTVTPDGSDITEVLDASEYCWSGKHC
jgi:Tol biopolymer transport system component